MAVESRFSSLKIAARNGRDEFRTSSLRLSGAGGANGIRGGVGETKKTLAQPVDFDVSAWW